MPPFNHERPAVVSCPFHVTDPLVNALVADEVALTATRPGYGRTPVRVIPETDPT